MSIAYRVCIIIPPGYTHASCFAEVGYLLHASLFSLGIDCDIRLNELSRERINIILGSHLMRFGDYLGQYRYIPYQLEQLSEREGVYSENVHTILSHAFQVWDYSIENMRFLDQKGIRAKHVPVGYHANLEQIADASVKDIDVFFYGSSGPRRQRIIDALAGSPGIAVKQLFGVYGKERDAWIARSKIILNIHHYSTNIFEAVRVSFLLNNRCFVLSEESTVYPYPGVEVPLVASDSVVSACLEWLRQPEKIDARRRLTYEQFKDKYPMTSILAKVIEES
jgi:hypothetical protein